MKSWRLRDRTNRRAAGTFYSPMVQWPTSEFTLESAGTRAPAVVHRALLACFGDADLVAAAMVPAHLRGICHSLHSVCGRLSWSGSRAVLPRLVLGDSGRR